MGAAHVLVFFESANNKKWWSKESTRLHFVTPGLSRPKLAKEYRLVLCWEASVLLNKVFQSRAMSAQLADISGQTSSTSEQPIPHRRLEEIARTVRTASTRTQWVMADIDSDVWLGFCICHRIWALEDGRMEQHHHCAYRSPLYHILTVQLMLSEQHSQNSHLRDVHLHAAATLQICGNLHHHPACRSVSIALGIRRWPEQQDQSKCCVYRQNGDAFGIGSLLE